MLYRETIQAGLLKDIANLVWLLKGINDNHLSKSYLFWKHKSYIFIKLLWQMCVWYNWCCPINLNPKDRCWFLPSKNPAERAEEYNVPLRPVKRVDFPKVVMNFPGKQLAEAPMRDIFYIKYPLHHDKHTPPVSQQRYVNVRKGNSLSVNYILWILKIFCRTYYLSKDCWNRSFSASLSFHFL